MRFRFSLFTLVILLTIAALIVGVGANRARVARANQKTIDELRAFQILAKFEDGTVPQKGRSDGFWSLLTIKRIDRADNIMSDKAMAQIADLTDLRFLQINDPVTDSGLEHLKKLRKLEELKIFGAAITDGGLDRITHLQNLKKLDLSFCPLTNECLSHVVQLDNLESLSVANTQITDEGMSVIAKLPRLRELKIQNTTVSNAGLENLSKAKSLELVDITDTQATYGGLGDLLFDSLNRPFGDWFVTSSQRYSSRPPPHDTEEDRLAITLKGIQYEDEAIKYLVSGSPNTNTLELYSTAITDRGMNELASLRELDGLTIEGADQVSKISGFRSLKYLRFYNLGEEPIPRLADMPQLGGLYIENGIGSTETYRGAGLEEALRGLRSSPKFTNLVVRSASLTDDAMKVICEMPNLESLTIDGQALTDQGMSHLANLTKLRQLRVLGGARVTDESVATLKSLSQLTFLSVHGTAISKGAMLDFGKSLPNCELRY